VKLTPISVTLVEGVTDYPGDKEPVPKIDASLDFHFWTGKEWKEQRLQTVHVFSNYVTGKALSPDKIAALREIIEENLKRQIWRFFHILIEAGEIEIEGTTYPILGLARYPLVVNLGGE